jgi:hypothetical protein
MLPHAPQFFAMPEAEDRATVAQVTHEIGRHLEARWRAGSSAEGGVVPLLRFLPACKWTGPDDDA